VGSGSNFANDVRGSPGYWVAGASDRWSTSLDGQPADLRTAGDTLQPIILVWLFIRFAGARYERSVNVCSGTVGLR
jgi:hypothetical protein